MNETPVNPPTHRVSPPYYEVTVRLPLDLYSEAWFYKVANAAGDDAAVSGSIIPLEVEPDSALSGLLWEVARASRVAGNDGALAILVTEAFMEQVEEAIGFDEMGG